MGAPRRGGDQPLYKRVYARIIAEARSGKLPVGTAIPPIRNLAATYDVGVSTMCRAIAELKRNGLVEAKRGGGVYLTASALGVAPHHMQNSEVDLQPSGILCNHAGPIRLKLDLLDGSDAHRAMWQRLLARYAEVDRQVAVEVAYGGRADDKGRLGSDLVQLQVPELLDQEWWAGLQPIPPDVIRGIPFAETTFQHLLAGGGSVWGVPVYLSMPVLLVNKRLFDLANVPLAVDSLSWGELLSAMRLFCNRRTEIGRLRDVDVFGYIHSTFLLLCATTGVLAQSVRKGSVDWRSDIVRDFFVFIQELGSGSGIIPRNETYWNQGGILRAFLADRLAVAAVLRRNVNDLYPHGLPTDVAALPFPLAPGGSALWQSGNICVARSSCEPDAAMSLLRFLGGCEAMQIVLDGKEMPAACHPGLLVDRGFRQLMERSYPANILSAEECRFIRACYNMLADRVRDGHMGPDAAFAALCERSDACGRSNVERADKFS